MNERLRELMLEAGYAAPELAGRGQKLAELIVSECIAIADDLVDRNEDGSWTSTELYTDYNGALFEVKRRIEKHFGVEL
jgi:hypothetical protein